MLVLSNRQIKIRKALGLNPKHISPKGWYVTSCPYCGNKNKFGIIFTKKYLLSFNCFKCQEHGTGSVLLKFLELTSLLEGYTENLTSVENPFNELVEDLIKDVPKKHPPLGWKRVFDDTYLNGRGFESWQYDKYPVGRTQLYSPLKNYVIFLIEENCVNKGYIARHVWSKEKIKEKEASGELVLRYRNEGGVDFGMLVFGLDEIDEKTETVIIVEGITDKFNVEKLLSLSDSNKTVVLCTFGKKVSSEQFLKIKTKGVSVRLVYLMFDPDAIESIKRTGIQIELEWLSVNVFIGFHFEKDPGDLNERELQRVLYDAMSPSKFNQTVVGKRKIKR